MPEKEPGSRPSINQHRYFFTGSDPLPVDYLRKVLILAFGYSLAGTVGLLLAVPPGYATAVWPPSGIALMALLCWG